MDFWTCCHWCLLSSRGHEAYLRTGPHYDFLNYRQLVHEITQAFCGNSKEVLEIKGKLHHGFDRPDLSEHIEKLQLKEQQKLELVRNLIQRGQREDRVQQCIYSIILSRVMDGLYPLLRLVGVDEMNLNRCLNYCYKSMNIIKR